ncbi:hypothetical protein GCM10010965_32310 [Caldalkalibacillus thermarum]|uniref:DUF6710 family protein n=1 Tax=Caldalkalibacillus thermarum TaxID=296745 RepID=UPI00166BCA3A|nr:DUF6710 family protein [Caldalkalibacillus thermarum]GGK36958.1 hypothetical protein GCM10010965_32310 [Caldalkalibacillus thermarum]
MLNKILEWNRQNTDLPEKHKLPYPGFEYLRVFDLLESWMEKGSKEDKIALIDFVLDVLREDVKTDLLTTIMYGGKHFSDVSSEHLFPSRFQNRQGVWVKSYMENKKNIIWLKKIDPLDDCVWVMPRRWQKLKDRFVSLFERNKDNCKAYFYTHINVCQIHAVNVGTVSKKGSIIAQVCDLSRLFDHVYTDGDVWYNAHNNEKLGDVFDFRLAIMYELARQKHQLTRGYVS